MSSGQEWVDLIVAGLLFASGLLVVVSAVGFLRLREFFLRMHPPALAYTLAAWCVAGAAALYLSVAQDRLVLHPLLLPALLALTVPVTTVLLARVSLFRQRKRELERGRDPAAPDAQPGEGGKSGSS